MKNPTHEFVTVDMRGLKATLVAHAIERRMSVSALVRGAVAGALGPTVESEPGQGPGINRADASADRVKLSIRMTAEEARQLTAGARAAGLSRGAYLAGLVSNVPVLSSGGSRVKSIATLAASNAELAALSRNVHQLSVLLRQADAEPARQYRSMLDTLAGDVRQHLALAARALCELQPGRGSAVAPVNTCRTRTFPWPKKPTSMPR